MAKPFREDVPEFYRGYIDLLNDDSILDHLQATKEKTLSILSKLPESKAEFAYASGKWTIKELVQHIADAETVFAYRALWIARNEENALPGFDHNNWVKESRANRFDLDTLLNEYLINRDYSISIFSKYDQEELERSKSVNGFTMTCNLLGYLISGHNLHHLNVIQERYL